MGKTVGDKILHWTGRRWLLDGNEYDQIDLEIEVPDVLRGRTIKAVSFEIGTGFGNDLVLRLDNDVVICVSGWGHDWWGTHVFLVKPNLKGKRGSDD